MDVVVLCGGLGARISPVLSDTPKILAPIGERVFLDILLEDLAKAGFRKVILSTGHLGKKIADYVKNSGWGREDSRLTILFSQEEEPLGTGGAAKYAEPHIESNRFVLMNGDTIFDVDFEKLYESHIERGAHLSLVLAEQADGDYASVVLDKNGRVTDYKEKQSIEGTALVSAGLYIMNRELLSKMQDKPFSIELDFFPNILDMKCYGFLSDGGFLDIGTPERYKEASDYREMK
jgi:D-glycero-alpha-D-manno-heptose 1-phosphate guanylyltransferase